MEGKSRKTHFFKPSRPPDSDPVLNPVHVNQNRIRGTGTTLVLDANMLIVMEKVVKHGNKPSLLKEWGLLNFVNLLRRCLPGSVSLVPSLALAEMPPARAERSRLAFDSFLSMHLPGFTDAPGALQATYEGKETDWGFFDLATEEQAVMAFSFASLIHLALIDRDVSLAPIEKFRRYLSTVCRELDLLSSMEAEIARFCYSDPPPSCRRLREVTRVFRRNFLKRSDDKLPRTKDELLAVAFNGACDLRLLNVTNRFEAMGIDGVRQDCWIATQDTKLATFSGLSHHVNVDGEPGKFSAQVPLEEHDQDHYWQMANDELASERLRRSLTERTVDFPAIIAAAYRAADQAEAVFAQQS